VLDEASGRLGEAEGLEQLSRSRLGVGPPQPEEAPEQEQVLAAREVLVDGRELSREADEPAHRVGLGRDVAAEYARRAGVRLEQRREDPDRGRLPGAVRPEDAVDGAGADGEVDAVDGAHVAERLHEAGGLDREWGVGSHRSSASPTTTLTTTLLRRARPRELIAPRARVTRQERRRGALRRA
jgi:hypothetical protein